MMLRARLSIVAGVICGALVIAGTAWAAASTRITLAQGLDNPHGKIFSTSKSCLGNRKVIAFMQKGSTQNPAVDQKMDTTTSTRQGTIEHLLGHGGNRLPEAEELLRGSHQEDRLQGRLQQDAKVHLVALARGRREGVWRFRRLFLRNLQTVAAGCRGASIPPSRRRGSGALERIHFAASRVRPEDRARSRLRRAVAPARPPRQRCSLRVSSLSASDGRTFCSSSGLSRTGGGPGAGSALALASRLRAVTPPPNNLPGWRSGMVAAIANPVAGLTT